MKVDTEILDNFAYLGSAIYSGGGGGGRPTKSYTVDWVR